MHNNPGFLILLLCLLGLQAGAQQAYSAGNGHSHNDYNQKIPFLQAYYAGMGSVEADVFLRNGKLMVAHEQDAINPLNTLDKLYLQPIAELMAKNRGRIDADTGRRLQLLVDIKEEYADVIPELINELKLAGRPDIRVIAGGVIPPADYEALRAAGVGAIFGPGTNILAAAEEMLRMLGHNMPPRGVAAG